MTMLVAPQMTGPLGRYGIRHAALLDGSTGYFSRTPIVDTNHQKFTFDFWYMKDKTYSANGYLYSSDGSGYFAILWEGATDKLWVIFEGSTYGYKTTATLRDCTGFLNIHIAIDTTQATAADRISVEINGVAQTFSSSATVPMNYSTTVNNTGTDFIGALTAAGPRLYTGGYYAAFNFVDGQRLAASDFGRFDPVSGNWIVKKYAGTYGANGFHLNFSNAENLGEDQSGNGNHWTVNGTIAQVTSTPTNVYATWNPLITSADAGIAALTNGNRSTVGGGTAMTTGTFATGPSGKYYWEVVQDSLGSTSYSGVRNTSVPHANLNDADVNWVYLSTGTKTGDGSYATAYGAAYTAADIIGVAVDIDSGTLEFFKNGVSQGTAFTSLAGISVTPFYVTGGSGAGTIVCDENDWTYSAPTGFKSLSTDNLPAVTGKNVNEHFKTVLHTGTGAAQSITTDFDTDLAIIKARSSAYNWRWQDTLRGAGKTLSSSTTDAENTESDSITGLTSTGVTLGADTGSGVNQSGVTYVGAYFSLPTDEVNSSGTITVTWKYNATLGMAVGTYTGNGTAGATLGLPTINGEAPGMFIVKNRATAARSWMIYHKNANANPETGVLILDGTGAFSAGSTFWNNTAPTGSAITLGTNGQTNANTDDYVVYAFWESDFIKIGSYIGNGSADGPLLNGMISPVWALTKLSSHAGDGWFIHDAVRSSENVVDDFLLANSSAIEVVGNVNSSRDFIGVGQKLRGASTGTNTTGYTYIYMMIGQPTGTHDRPPAPAR